MTPQKIKGQDTPLTGFKPGWKNVLPLRDREVGRSWSRSHPMPRRVSFVERRRRLPCRPLK